MPLFITACPMMNGPCTSPSEKMHPQTAHAPPSRPAVGIASSTVAMTALLRPSTFRGPRFSASQLPGICVNTYPGWKALSSRARSSSEKPKCWQTNGTRYGMLNRVRSRLPAGHGGGQIAAHSHG